MEDEPMEVASLNECQALTSTNKELVRNSYSLIANSAFYSCDETAQMQMFYNEANCKGNSSEIIAVWNQCYGPMIVDNTADPQVKYYYKLTNAIFIGSAATASSMLLALFGSSI